MNLKTLRTAVTLDIWRRRTAGSSQAISRQHLKKTRSIGTNQFWHGATQLIIFHSGNLWKWTYTEQNV